MKTSTSLTAREHQALALLARYRFLVVRQLQEFIFSTQGVTPRSQEVMTGRLLGTLRSNKLVTRTIRPLGGTTGGSGPYVYSATAEGLRVSGLFSDHFLPRRPSPRGAFLIAHSLRAADIALVFYGTAQTRPGHAVAAWECDWEIAQRFGRQLVVPDAYAVYQTPTTELHALIEVDLGTAGTRAFAKKIEGYLDLYRSGAWRTHFDPWPTVLVVTPNKRRADLLRHATATLIAAQPDRKMLHQATEFAFTDFNSLAKDPLAGVWTIAGRVGSHALLTGSDL